ncbi:MAG: redoxin domain-containing protein [Nitrospirales bacterium]|nr:TlpA family protein disulfide reductase [Nitrospirales bacterium]
MSLFRFKKMTHVLAALVIGGGLVLNVAGCDSGYSEDTPVSRSDAKPTARAPRPTLGSQAPEFRLLDMDGRSVALSDMQGKVVLLNFWATWCFPCRVEMPSMEALYRSYREKGLEILAVSVDEQGPAVTRPFQEDKGLTFPILHDRDYQVGLIYGARSLPMTYIIDRQGIIRERVFGSREWDTPEARQSILKILEESAARPSQNSSHTM